MVSSTASYRKLKTACCWLHSVISHSVALKRGGNNHHHPKVQAANQNNDLKAKERSIQCTCTHYHVINQQNRPFEQSVRNCWSTPTHHCPVYRNLHFGTGGELDTGRVNVEYQHKAITRKPVHQPQNLPEASLVILGCKTGLQRFPKASNTENQTSKHLYVNVRPQN